MAKKPNPSKGKTAHEFVWDGRDERGEDARLSIVAGRAASDLELTLFDLRLLLHLGRFNNRKGWCRLSQTGLAKMFDTSRQTVSERIKYLVKENYIAKRSQKKTGESFCHYRVILDDVDGVSAMDDTPGGVSAPGDTRPGVSAEDDTRGGVSGQDDTGGVSAPDDTSVGSRGDTSVKPRGDTPIYKERARLHVGHVDKKETEDDAQARGTDIDAARSGANQHPVDIADAYDAADAEPRFSQEAIRELTAIGVDVAALVERFQRRTKGRHIDDPSAYLLAMGRDDIAKRHGVAVDAVKAMGSRDPTERAKAALAVGTFTGPSQEAVTRARRFRNPHVEAALTMMEGRTFPTMFAADKAFEMALANARFAPGRAASAAL